MMSHTLLHVAAIRRSTVVLTVEITDHSCFTLFGIVDHQQIKHLFKTIFENLKLDRAEFVLLKSSLICKLDGLGPIDIN